MKGALELLDQEGSQALSMRTLADHLGSGTAVLYRNVGSREALISRVVDEVFGEVDIDARRLKRLSWELALREIALAMFEVLNRHPHLAPLLAERVPLGENAMRVREHCLAVLLTAKFSPAQAARMYTTVARYVVGFAIQARRGDDDAQVSATLREVDPDRFPATSAVSGTLPISIDDEFRFGLELLLAGARVTQRVELPG